MEASDTTDVSDSTPTRDAFVHLISAHFVAPTDTNVAQAAVLIDALKRFDAHDEEKGDGWRDLSPAELAANLDRNLKKAKKGDRDAALDVVNFAAMLLRATDGDPYPPEPDLPVYDPEDPDSAPAPEQLESVAVGYTPEEVAEIHRTNGDPVPEDL